jgi:hypothetical protein
MEERNKLIKELFELHRLLADKGEIGIGYGFSKNYNRIEKQVKKLTLTDVVSSAFLVQHKETLINYGLFSTRKKAENYINKNTDLFAIQEVKIA